MGRALNLSLDLGGDSLKIAFAYSVNADGAVRHENDIVYGKIGVPGYMLKIAFPAVACHNAEKGKWVYGDKVDTEFDGSFVRVVRIKDLISLLQYGDCAYYYDRRSHFPRFYFPSSRDYKLIENFPESVRFGDTFDAGVTPKDVCLGYFRYVAGVVKERIAEMSKTFGIKFTAKDLRIAIVHQPKVGKRYIDELTYLVKESFGVSPSKILSTTKSLGMYAKHRGVFDKVDEALIVDMGEEDISVARVFSDNGKVIIDGEEGHSDPLPLGGNDMDYAIADMIKKEISEVSPFGAFGSDRSEREDPMYEKQYLFMKSVKSAKVALSKKGAELGAMIGIYYETYKQSELMRDSLCKCIGTDKPYDPKAGDTRIAPRIAQYIINELQGEVNIDIVSPMDGESFGAVILSGGLAECYSLKEYIKAAVERAYPGVRVLSFDEKEASGSEFSILSYEDSAYAPAVGGAIVSLKNEDISTGLSLSYATWGTFSEPGRGSKYVLSVFVNRGEQINPGDVFSAPFYFTRSRSNSLMLDTVIENEEIYSAAITTRDMMRYGVAKDTFFKKKYRGSEISCVNSSSDGRWYLGLDVDSPSEFPRSREGKLARLKSVSGGRGTKIELHYAYRDGVTGKTVTRRIDALKSVMLNVPPKSLAAKESIIVEEKGRIRVAYEILPPSESQESEYLAHFAGAPRYDYVRVNVSQMFVIAPGVEPIIPVIG
ncbi:MAG: hypothetical protein IJY18_03080 [Clostridia bacterium]|nr:hypothetical protein [Clostridia bacterium]